MKSRSVARAEGRLNRPLRLRPHHPPCNLRARRQSSKLQCVFAPIVAHDFTFPQDFVSVDKVMKRRDFLRKWGLSGLKIKAGFLEGEFVPNDPDREAAWELYIEL